MPSESDQGSWRVLVALVVYRGGEFVGQCLRSLATLENGAHEVDVLVLDDASPDLGWSDDCRRLTKDLGFSYYRTPRHLGISRNRNLGMLQGLHGGYDAVVLLDSDTVLPRNLIPTLVAPLLEDETISSTTAWSNDVNGYSLPNEDPNLGSDQQFISWISQQLAVEFEGRGIPVPSGVGFCMAIPTSVIDDVGLMDPVFGSGKSGVIDWCLRSHLEGFRSVLAPSCFTYRGRRSTTAVTGTIGRGDHSVHAEQAVIEDRYPLYRPELEAFTSSRVLSNTIERGLRRVVVKAARQQGYDLEVSRLANRPGHEGRVRFIVDPEGVGQSVSATHRGFTATFGVGDGGVIPAVAAIVGRPPDEIRILGRDREARSLLEDLSDDERRLVRRAAYRERVF